MDSLPSMDLECPDMRLVRAVMQKGPGARRSFIGALRRIDCVCGSPRLLRCAFDTWVERHIDVAIVRDDQSPAVVELCWQVVALDLARAMALSCSR